MLREMHSIACLFAPAVDLSLSQLPRTQTHSQVHSQAKCWHACCIPSHILWPAAAAREWLLTQRSSLRAGGKPAPELKASVDTLGSLMMWSQALPASINVQSLGNAASAGISSAGEAHSSIRRLHLFWQASSSFTYILRRAELLHTFTPFQL